ncbi:MAG: hypothetical protein ACREUK_02470, partial [Burkholderiales bacterium]
MSQRGAGGAVRGDMSREDFVWTLGQLCALHRVPFDPGLLLGQFPPPYSQEKLFAALGALGFRAGRGQASALDAKSAPLPCIAFRREGVGLAPVIVAGSDATQLAYFQSSSREPQMLPLADAGAAFEPEILLLRRDAAPADDPDDARARPQAFGFKWFV